MALLAQVVSYMSGTIWAWKNVVDVPFCMAWHGFYIKLYHKERKETLVSLASPRTWTGSATLFMTMQSIIHFVSSDRSSLRYGVLLHMDISRFSLGPLIISWGHFGDIFYFFMKL